jgi:hypothetical protein
MGRFILIRCAAINLSFNGMAVQTNSVLLGLFKNARLGWAANDKTYVFWFFSG